MLHSNAVPLSQYIPEARPSITGMGSSKSSFYAWYCLQQEVRQVEQAGTNGACWRTEFGLICLQQPESQPQQPSQTDQSRVSEAVTAPDRLRTEFGEVTLLSPSTSGETGGDIDTARAVKTQFGEVRLLDSRQGRLTETTQARSADAKQDRPAQAPTASGSQQFRQPAQALKTEFGEVKILGEPMLAVSDMRLLPGACAHPLQGSRQQFA